MDASWIVPVCAIIDTLMVHLDHPTHPLAHVPDSEVLTVAVVAAKYFQNHHERALVIMHGDRSPHAASQHAACSMGQS